MIHAYDEVFLQKAETVLGGMLDCAVHSLHLNAQAFMNLFIASGAASRFEQGDIRTITGMSGAELAYEIMELSGLEYTRIQLRFTTGQSREYSLGQILTRCQWETGLSFDDIIDTIPTQDIFSMIEEQQNEMRRKLQDIWPPLPNMNDPAEKAKRTRDIVLTVSSLLIEKVSSANHETHLKTIRRRNGMSQSKLASASGVPLRTIQQYEQRQKDINRAQFEYLVKLAAALNCDPLQLFERT
ncbi:MAG: helix-turn-helix transcriptional regulator [Eubacterium sp.]|nr:helix-turn-helix transcriptional regulator [Eubacterium sp.]